MGGCPTLGDGCAVGKFSMSVSVLRHHRRTEFTGEIKAAEVEIDRSEVQIELECLRILALYGPVASDLRRVLTVLQVNRARRADRRPGSSDCERRPPSWPLYRLPVAIPNPLEAARRAEDALSAVRVAVNALYAMSDARSSRVLIAAGHRLDDYQHQLQGCLKESIRREPDRIAEWLRLIDIARHLERAGDHAARIAEAVIFLKEGRIIRHKRLRSTAV